MHKVCAQVRAPAAALRCFCMARKADWGQARSNFFFLLCLFGAMKSVWT